jgi:hypothetical protein
MRTTVCRAAAALAAAAVPALADEKDDRIKKLEDETAELRRMIQEMKSGRAPEAEAAEIRAAVDAYLAKRAAGGAPAATYAGPGGVSRPTGNVTLGGYFSTRYLDRESAHTKPSFVDMRLVPQIHASVSPGIAFDAEIEWEHGGVSDEVDGEIVIEYAELSFRCSDEFKFKAGTLLVPFGAFNQSHDDPINELSSRPSVAFRIVPAAFAVPGIGVEGTWDLNPDTALTYDVILCNGLKDEFDGDEGSRAARGLFEVDDNHDKTVFARTGFAPSFSLVDAMNVGVSGALGAVGAQSDRLLGWGVDASAKRGPWEFKGEYDRFMIDRDDGVPRSVAVSGMHGWYAQLLYRMTDPWVRSLPFAQKDASVAVLVRRDDIDLNDHVHGWGPSDDERAWSLGVNYRPTSKTVVKLEYRRASSGAAGDIGEDRSLWVVEFATYF